MCDAPPKTLWEMTLGRLLADVVQIRSFLESDLKGTQQLGDARFTGVWLQSDIFHIAKCLAWED